MVAGVKAADATRSTVQTTAPDGKTTTTDVTITTSGTLLVTPEFLAQAVDGYRSMNKGYQEGDIRLELSWQSYVEFLEFCGARIFVVPADGGQA